VPLMMRYDGVFPPGERRSQMVGLHDLFSTICDLSGVPVPDFQAQDSVSFADYIVSNDPAGLRETMGHWLHSNQRRARAVRKGPYKFVQDLFEDPKNPVEYLYNLEEDLAEANNLIAQPQHAALVDEMRSHLYRMEDNTVIEVVDEKGDVVDTWSENLVLPSYHLILHFSSPAKVPYENWNMYQHMRDVFTDHLQVYMKECLGLAPDHVFEVKHLLYRTYPDKFSAKMNFAGTELASDPFRQAGVPQCMREAFTSLSALDELVGRLRLGPGAFPDMDNLEVWLNEDELVAEWSS